MLLNEHLRLRLPALAGGQVTRRLQKQRDAPRFGPLRSAQAEQLLSPRKAKLLVSLALTTSKVPRTEGILDEGQAGYAACRRGDRRVGISRPVALLPGQGQAPAQLTPRPSRVRLEPTARGGTRCPPTTIPLLLLRYFSSLYSMRSTLPAPGLLGRLARFVQRKVRVWSPSSQLDAIGTRSIGHRPSTRPFTTA